MESALESFTICRCHYKLSSTFSSIMLRPWVLVRSGFEPSTSRTLVRCSTTEPTGRRLGMVSSSRRNSWNKFADLKHPKQPQPQALSPLLRGANKRELGNDFYSSSLSFSRIRKEERKQAVAVVRVWAWYANARAASSTSIGRRTKCLPALTRGHLFCVLPHGLPSKTETTGNWRGSRFLAEGVRWHPRPGNFEISSP